ncbi:hypothetical protein T12_7925 [Trichinella patagoniensis]|uniref:Uncharacterized protein n=1 Tax=Trichinella patagoniensis TaxID=990121 RepID=A0A0V1AET5_9BILA|nr:hypothetical protein T12_7925 [Trichinella patagoniensis]
MNCFVTSQAPEINLPARQRLNQVVDKRLRMLLEHWLAAAINANKELLNYAVSHTPILNEVQNNCNRRPGAHYRAVGNLEYHLFQTRQKEPQEDLATISRKSGPILDHQKGYGVVDRGVICHGDCWGLPRLRPLKFDFIFVICCSVIGCTAFDRGRKVNTDSSDRENSPETECPENRGAQFKEVRLYDYDAFFTGPRKTAILGSCQIIRVPTLAIHLTGILTRPMENCPMNFKIHEWREMHIKGSGLNRTACKTIVKIYKPFHLVIVELQQQLKDDIAS